MAVFNQERLNGELPNSMKASITRLFHNKDNKLNLKKWHPISLLNVYYKICPQAVSNHLANVLGSIMEPDQTCSIPGTTIFSNLPLLRDCFH